MKGWLIGVVLALVLAAGWLATSRGTMVEKGVERFAMRRLAADPAGSGDASLSPDGERFITSLKRGGQWDLWMFEISSGAWTRLTDHPADDFEARFSPDGSSVVFTSRRSGQKDLWLLSLASGELQRLTTSEEDDEYPAFSADGRRVVYTTGAWTERRFAVVEAATGRSRSLTEPFPFGGACTFHPDGASLFCHTYDQGSGRLQRRWLDGAEVTPLTAGADWDYKPAPSPDGAWLAFSRSQEGPGDLWLLSLEDGRARALVQSPYEDRWPQWDASGERLFFHRLADRGVGLKVLDRRSGEVVTVVGPEEEPIGGSFGPRGERVVYCAQSAERKVLRLLDLTTGERRELDTGGGDACYPDFSPDGTWIAFASRRALGERWQISAVRPDGGGLMQLTAEVEGLRGLDGPIDVSPDGRRIVFHGDTEPFAADLYTVDLERRQVEKLVDDPWFDEAPSWTPDGEGVVFMSTRGGDWTWGFFRLSLEDGRVESLDEPDYLQRNYPRQGADGVLVWTFYGDDGVETLAERTPGGEVRVWTEAGAGARWPSLSADGRRILYTAVERRVEYWLIEHPLGRGSPAHAAPRSQRRNAALPALDGRVALSARERSPVDLFRR